MSSRMFAFRTDLQSLIAFRRLGPITHCSTPFLLSATLVIKTTKLQQVEGHPCRPGAYQTYFCAVLTFH